MTAETVMTYDRWLAAAVLAMEITFRQFVDDDEAADCALAAHELIRNNPPPKEAAP